MSTCKSQGTASSCSTMPPPPVAAIERATGADPILVTDAVVEKVAQILAEEGDSAMCLRVFVSGGGCSGLQYGFSIEDAPAENDVLVQRGVLSVVVDPMSLQYLAGAEIDFQDGLEGATFIIRNPNASGTCGCGNSFSI